MKQPAPRVEGATVVAMSCGQRFGAAAVCHSPRLAEHCRRSAAVDCAAVILSLSLILCFEGRQWYRRRFFILLLPIALAVMIYALSPEFENASPQLQIALFFGGCLFVA